MLEFFSKRKEKIKDSVLRQKSLNSHRSNSPAGTNQKTKDLYQFPNIANKIITKSANKIKYYKIKDAVTMYKSYNLKKILPMQK